MWLWIGVASAQTCGLGQPPPLPDLALRGQGADHVLETEHFAVTWSTGDADAELAEWVGWVAERAWSSLIDVQGWPEPAGSDQWLVWITLQPDLPYTGWTTVEPVEGYPLGVPVVLLDPDRADNPVFFENLIAHEVVHTLQYAMTPLGAGPAEAWFWEASAQWGAELAAPDVDGHAPSSMHYALQPELRVDSLVDSHPYGMFVLNAYLDGEHPGATLEIWQAERQDPDAGWLDHLEPLDTLWSEFTHAYGNGLLAESDLYTPVRTQGDVVPGAQGTLPLLGTHYFTVPDTLWVEVEGPVVLSGGARTVHAGEVVAVTGLQDDASYRLITHAGPGGCGCGGGGGAGLLAAGLALIAVARRRLS